MVGIPTSATVQVTVKYLYITPYKVVTKQLVMAYNVPKDKHKT